MVPTRRWTVFAGAACFFVVFAVILDEPAPLFAAGGLTAWLLAAQLDSFRTMAAADDALSTSVSVEPSTVPVGNQAVVTLAASLASTIDAPLDVELASPPSVDVVAEEQRHLRVEAGEASGSTVCRISCPVAGHVSFDTLRVTLRGRLGLFTETTTVETDATCLVEPPSPDGIHVGQGGERTGTIFGEHASTQSGPGLVPHETRRYLPGDTLSQIDWRTTARMNYPHIREFESESDLLLSLVVDVGSNMAAGPDGRTMFAYAREVALGLVETAASYNDPLSVRLVTDEGTAWEFGPSSSSNAYHESRRELLAFDPPSGATHSSKSASPLAPADALARRETLETDDSPFATTLRPYLSASRTYLSRVSERPLFDAVKTACHRVDGDDHLVLVTDDTSNVETYEAAVVASQRCTQTTVFLTPTALFAEAPTDRSRLVAFEEFRQRLDGLPSVEAYEIAPRTALERATTDTKTPTT
ncbi:DUF58 domain-containing protein [Haloferax namakaokahaiae]|uniref:DUF58 domain-containing protein n=1 Tax=Haloferax namakaokahaiae TaxID=1748331 RepID=A0ABD5ZBG7_9EURY